MISYLAGRIHRLSREHHQVVVLAGGVGYEVILPAFVLQALINEGVKEGGDVELEIYYHVTDRQPRPMLVGFKRPHEKRFFEQLIQVEGVGPARAAAALVFSVSTIARAIENEDVRTLTQMPGIGQRAAQKMVATLRGKVMDTALLRDEGYSARAQTASPVEGGRGDAIEVLVGLGYRPAEARARVDEILADRPELATDTQDLMREIFRAQVAAAP